MAPPPSRALLWGGGGHGKVLADLARACGYVVAGFVDADPAKLLHRVEPGGARVVALQEELQAALASGAAPPGRASVVLLAIGDNRTRVRCLAVLGERCAPGLVHPAAVVSPSATIGKGTVVLAGALVNADARVGEAVILNTGCIVEHDCVVGEGAHVSPGAILTGGVRVGERSWIGAGATVIPGVSIGADVVVGAGTVVLRDVPDGETLVGNPGRSVGRPPERA